MKAARREWTLFELDAAIDSWMGSLKVSELIVQYREPFAPNDYEPFGFSETDVILIELANVIRLAPRGWIQSCPRIISLPSGNSEWEILGYCFKFDNNGTTYIAIQNEYVDCLSKWLESNNAHLVAGTNGQ